MTDVNRTELHSPTLTDPTWPRWLRPGYLLLLVLFLGSVIWYAGTELADEQRLQAVVTELGRTDPHWRFEAIERNRRTPPPGGNSAPRVLGVRALLPQTWPPESFEEIFRDLPPERMLNPHQATVLAAELGRLQPAVAAARRLKDFPSGRYSLAYRDDGISTCLPHLQACVTGACLEHAYPSLTYGEGKYQPGSSSNRCKAASPSSATWRALAFQRVGFISSSDTQPS